MPLTKVTIDDLKGRLERREPLLVLDVRSPKAWEESDAQLPGAMRIPPDEVGEHLEEFPRDRPIIAYCA
ncbi:MAG TPA: rhodanese-like domain-containing protein [Acidobacteriota bacterium]|jgi:rhodanese-related sulfurtransferase